MQPNGIAMEMDNGTIHYCDRSEPVREKAWSPHPKFKGVSLKHLVTGADTNGQFSSHMVKIEPEGCLDTHCHENAFELHEIIDGSGSGQLVDQTLDYHPGKMVVIPMGKNHRVRAGAEGLTLLAKFFPALL